MVKPGGTGRPRTDVISARLAPLPPRRSFRSMGARRCLWSKLKTYGTSRRLGRGRLLRDQAEAERDLRQVRRVAPVLVVVLHLERPALHEQRGTLDQRLDAHPGRGQCGDDGAEP